MPEFFGDGHRSVPWRWVKGGGFPERKLESRGWRKGCICWPRLLRREAKSAQARYCLVPFNHRPVWRVGINGTGDLPRGRFDSKVWARCGVWLVLRYGVERLVDLAREEINHSLSSLPSPVRDASGTETPTRKPKKSFRIPLFELRKVISINNLRMQKNFRKNR